MLMSYDILLKRAKFQQNVQRKSTNGITKLISF